MPDTIFQPRIAFDRKFWITNDKDWILGFGIYLDIDPYVLEFIRMLNCGK